MLKKLKTFTLLQHEKCWKNFTLLQHYRVKFAQFFSWALCNKNYLIVLCWVTWSPTKTSLCLVETKSKLDTGTRTFVVQEQWRYSLKYRTKNKILNNTYSAQISIWIYSDAPYKLQTHPTQPRGGHPSHSNLVRGKLTSPTPNPARDGTSGLTSYPRRRIIM